jgi:hypothetical protein
LGRRLSFFNRRIFNRRPARFADRGFGGVLVVTRAAFS